MKKNHFIFLALAFVLSASSFAQSNLDQALPFDSHAIKGKLDNGLTYYVRENKKPEKRMWIYLAVKAGSILETEQQQGLAHFAEHMAFNGTKHFPKNELVSSLERMGVSFGGDLNAYTSFDQTVYNLQVPTDRVGLVDTAFMVMSDWSQYITFDSLEIEKERGVILEEWRLRLGAENRMMKQYFPVLFKGSRYAERLPIGTPEVIQNFKHETLKSFYKNWYKPELMAIIVVGDYPAAKMEQMVKQFFASIPKSKTPITRPYYSIPDNDAPLISIVSDKEATSQNVSINYKHPAQSYLNGKDFRRNLVYGLFNSMLNARLSEINEKVESPCTYAQTWYGNYLAKDKDSYELYAQSKENKLKEAFTVLVQENERVLRFGFVASELERQKQNYLSSYENSFKEKDKTESSNFVNQYLSSFLEDESCPNIETKYQLAKELVPQITLEEINALVKIWITDKNRTVLVRSPQKEGIVIPTQAELLQIMTEVKKADLKPYADVVVNEPLLAQKPKGSAIASRKESAVYKFTEITLANGVRVILKPTTFKSDEILLQGFSKGGTSLYPDKDLMSLEYLDIINGSGVGKFNTTSLSKRLAGNTASLSTYIGETEEGLSGNCSPKDLETMLQLAYLRFTEPRKDKENFEATMSKTRSNTKFAWNNPTNLFYDTLFKVQNCNNPRVVVLPTEEQLNQVNLDRMYQIYKERFANGADFTFTVIGNFKTDSILPLLQTYLGGLPSTKTQKETYIDRSSKFPDGISNVIVAKNTEPKASVRITMVGDFDYSYNNLVAFWTMKGILNIRLRENLREDKGGTYGVRMYADAQHEPRKSYYVVIQFGCSPNRVDSLVQCVFDELKKIREKGPSEDDLNKIKAEETRKHELNQEYNGWWLYAMKEYAEHGEERIIDYPKILNAITCQDIQKMAQKYITLDHYVKGILLPKK